MKQFAVVLVLMFIGFQANAQHPYSITRAFGTDLFPQYFYAMDTDGTLTSFTIDAPDFIGFYGSDYDQPRDRVVLIARETGGARLISIDPSLAPGSMVTLRSGLDANAQRAHVDPDTGRIYWWQNDEILSVSSDGTGALVVEADSVPEPTDMDIDAGRGFYAIVSSSELMIGNLDGAGSASPLLIPQQIPGASQTGVGLDPVTGDIYWAEIDDAGGFVGIATAVYRVPHDNPLAAAQRMLGSEDHILGLVPVYQDVAVIGNQVAAASMTGNFQGQTLTILNTTTDQIVANITPAVTADLSIAFDVDPIVQQPVGGIVDQGGTGVLEVIPSDAQSTYQWYRDGIPVAEDGRVSGVTTNKLSITDAHLSDTDSCSCSVTTSEGEQQISDDVIFAVRGTQGQDCTADLNGDGVLNFFDVSAFIAAFNAGCP